MLSGTKSSNIIAAPVEASIATVAWQDGSAGRVTAMDAAAAASSSSTAAMVGGDDEAARRFGSMHRHLSASIMKANGEWRMVNCI